MTAPRGILLVDKPPGPTSHDVVARLRKTLSMKKIGHAGTLDPFASGLLLLLVGPATRLSEYFLGMDKSYQATVRLGLETDSHDSEGTVVAEDGGWAGVDGEAVEEALEAFRGPILQRPPVYSAKKVAGEAAHRRVRRGETVELEPVEVSIHELEATGFEPPDLRLRIRCSSGTYIRALARDLGRALGVGGHLTGLRRSSIGALTLDGALSWDALEDRAGVVAAFLPPARALGHLPTLRVTTEEARRLRQGQFLPLDAGVSREGVSFPVGEPIRVLLEDELLGIAASDGERIRPRKVLGDHG